MVDCTITIGSDSDPYGLLVISDTSDAILTSPRSFLLIFYLPLPLHTENNIVLCSLAPHKTLYRLDLTHTVFYCIPKHYTAYIDLDTLCSTPLYCVLSIILRFSSRYIGFALISFDLLLLTSDYVYGLTSSLTLIYPITIDQDIHPFYHHLSSYRSQPRNRFNQTFAPFRSFISFQCYIFYYILVLVWLFSDHTA
jgi:hypothetical protein